MGESHARRVARLSALGVFPLAACYVLTLASPLRLDTDSAWYLQISASVADGGGLHPAGAPEFPPGYPLLVGALDAAGLGTSWALVGLNLVLLAAGLAAAATALSLGLRLSRSEVGAVLGLTLLSVLVVKYSAMPQPEIGFLGASSAAVAVLSLARARSSVPLLLGGIALAAVACSMRTAGVALLPAIVLAAPSQRARLVAGIAVAAGAAVAVLAVPRYLDELAEGWSSKALHTAASEGYDLLESTGALLANAPASGIDRFSPALALVGLAGAAVIVTGFVVRRRELGPVDGWLLGTLALVFVWPAHHPRFLLPVLPYALGYVVLLGRRAPRPLLAYGAVFAVVGVVALGYSARLTLSGARFPERYADGVLAPTYRSAWGLARAGDRAQVDPVVLAALERYDPDARPRASSSER